MHLYKKKPKETTLYLILQMSEEVIASLFTFSQEHHALFLDGVLGRRLLGAQGTPSGSPACVLTLESL